MLTVMSNWQVDVLFDGSFAVQVTVFVRAEKAEPEGGEQVTVAEPLLSLAGGSP